MSARPALALALLASGCLINPGLRDERLEAFEPDGTPSGEPCEDTSSWYADEDGDGYGDPASEVSGCNTPPPTYIRDGTDCDDGDPTIHPGASDGPLQDRDCDGSGGTGDLADAQGILLGEPGAPLGTRIAPLGDFDGDSRPDFAIGQAEGSDVGKVWLITSGADFPSGAIDTVGIEGTGPDSAEVGGAVAGAGDLNGDGLNELLVGGPNLAQGRVWIIPGTAAPAPVSIGMVPVQFVGENTGDRAGHSVAGPGDLDGDGSDDFAIGAPEYGVYGPDGIVYVLFGGTLSVGATGLANADAMLYGPSYSEAGSSLAPAGDVDGDGIADLIVGAPGWSVGINDPGAAYVVLGAAGFSSIDLDSWGILLSGEVPGDRAGEDVAGVGDFDGDGVDDVLIGAPQRAYGSDSGGAYLVKGSTGSFPSINLDLAHISFQAALDGHRAGGAVAPAGDVNDDGQADLLIGATGVLSNRGAAYLILGTNSLAGTVDLGGVDHALVGENPNDVAGYALSGVGDLDRDGFGDLVVGAPLHQDQGSLTGAVYLIRGSGL